jgi:hypothetical protein
MTMISEKDLQELDRKIDSSIATQRLLSQPRDIALVHILRYFEDYVRLYAPKSSGPESYKAALKNGQTGMHFAVQWIFRYCPPPTSGCRYETRDATYREAHDLLELAMDYSIIWDLLTMVWRKRAVAEREKDGTIRIEYANQLVADGEMADRFIGTSDSPRLNVNSLNPAGTQPSFVQKIRTRSDNKGNVKYIVPVSTFNEVAKYWRKQASQLWELGGAWDLGGYTISQFRVFWIGLLTLCWIHFWACFSSGKQGGDLDNTALILSLKDWIQRLVTNCGLDAKTVGTILNDLTFDIGLYNPNVKQPDVTYQPFLPLHSDMLALSNWLVLLSSHERNIWDLVSIKRPTIHSVLRNKKEQVWLEELKTLLKTYGLSSYGPISFTLDSQSSDLDLLVFDHSSKFGLCCQLKWLTTPDRIKDVQYTENELNNGLIQAQLSLRWVTSLPVELQNIIGLNSHELGQYEFQALVLSKNTIGSGWIHLSGIPIVNMRLLMWVLGEPHHKSLRALWRIGEERRYMPKRGKHFRDEDIKVSFANVNLLGKNMGAKLIRAWDPAQDIDLVGLF